MPQTALTPPLAPTRRRRILVQALALVLLAVFLVQGLWAIAANSQTVDELPHFAAGYSYWATHHFRLNPEHPPLVKQLCLLPVYLAYDLVPSERSGGWHAASTNWIGLDLLYGPESEARPGNGG